MNPMHIVRIFQKLHIGLQMTIILCISLLILLIICDHDAVDNLSRLFKAFPVFICLVLHFNAPKEVSLQAKEEGQA